MKFMSVFFNFNYKSETQKNDKFLKELTINVWGFPGGASGKEPTCHCRRHKIVGSILGQEDPLEEGMHKYWIHSSVLA